MIGLHRQQTGPIYKIVMLTYCEMIMKYYPDILYAKYNFVQSVGLALKN